MEFYLGQIVLFAGRYAPMGWAHCDGSLMSIAEYEALYCVIGTEYGGDGAETFALPKLAPLACAGTGEAAVSYLICTSGDFPRPQ